MKPINDSIEEGTVHMWDTWGWEVARKDFPEEAPICPQNRNEEMLVRLGEKKMEIGVF